MSQVPPMFRMPVGFGPSPGPRRGPDGSRHRAEESVKTLSCELSFVTDPVLLAALLPPSFELRGDPVVTVAVGYHSEIAWLAGRSYNTFGVYIPATHRGSVQTDGAFNAVLWENLTDPILTGRDELGIPKLYAEIPPLGVLGINAYVARASWLGFEFARMEIHLEAPIDGEPDGPASPILGYKYVPKTGALGESDCEYAIAVPGDDPSRRVVECWQGPGSVAFFEAAWNDMPTQCHIVNRLAALPVVEARPGRMVSSVGQKDLSDTHRLP
jgi:Acetoacetate decarboxylase (ADC)